MKKKVLYIAAILICLSIITGGTAAYFTTADTARNVIAAGGVEVSIVERQLVNGTYLPYPKQPIPVMPATNLSKIVSVKNAGQAAWVRANYSVTVYDAAGEEMEIPAAELEQVIIIEPSDTSWIKKDGWWYYKDAVAAGAVTKPLFESVQFSGPNMDNKYQMCTIVIDVNAQAVQHAHNGTAVLEAQSWPKA